MMSLQELTIAIPLLPHSNAPLPSWQLSQPSLAELDLSSAYLSVSLAYSVSSSTDSLSQYMSMTVLEL